MNGLDGWPRTKATANPLVGLRRGWVRTVQRSDPASEAAGRSVAVRFQLSSKRRSGALEILPHLAELAGAFFFFGWSAGSSSADADNMAARELLKKKRAGRRSTAVESRARASPGTSLGGGGGEHVPRAAIAARRRRHPSGPPRVGGRGNPSARIPATSARYGDGLRPFREVSVRKGWGGGGLRR